MTFTTSRSLASLWSAARFAALLVACLLVAHDVVYAAQFGLGEGFAWAMTERGHGYWPAFTLLALLAGGLVAGLAGARLVVLAWRSRGLRTATQLDDPAPAARSYLREVGVLWPRLSVALVVAFAVQENVEHLARHDHPIGLGALTGPEYPLALPALALVGFVASALGALVRWRVAVLEARIAAATRVPLPRPLLAARPPAVWSLTGALSALHWILVRPDAGRAPPPFRS